MEYLNVPDLLIKYRGWAEKGKIQFLKKDSSELRKILSLLESLISDFSKAKEKGDLSENLDWQEAHKKGRDLWHELASMALNDIEPDSKGNSQLFDYLDKASQFEDLLYGLEAYYRDHTLHSLWVYFIGEYVLRELIPEKYNDLNWYIFNDIELEKSAYSQNLLKDAKDQEKILCEKVNKKKDAIWCIMALCHDLGYSLAKLDKLNKNVKDVLFFFDIPDFRHVGYSLNIEHHYMVAQFLELMAMDVRIVPTSDKKDVLLKCYKDDSTYWRLCRALEKKQHGILSAYLIYKILGFFADTWVRGPAEDWGLDVAEAADNIIRGDILFGISQHEFDFAHLNQLSSLADILIIADELEEFSRYGRPMLSRKYYDTTAEAGISIKKLPNGKDIEIKLKYEVAEHHPLEFFFKRKAEKLFKFYSLEQAIDESKAYAIKSIKMIAEKNEKKYFINIFRESRQNKGYLPGISFKGKKYNKGEYRIKCYDDKIHVYYTKDSRISLDEWFENVN